MKLVIDTSVFVSALLGTGASRAVLRNCLEGRSRPLMGTTLFAEYESLLGRETLFAGCPLNAQEREQLLDAFLSVCAWTRIYYLWRPNLRDEADNHLIELAVAGGARAIVTKNARDFYGSDLLMPQVLVLRPEQILQEEAWLR